MTSQLIGWFYAENVIKMTTITFIYQHWHFFYIHKSQKKKTKYIFFWLFDFKFLQIKLVFDLTYTRVYRICVKSLNQKPISNNCLKHISCRLMVKINHSHFLIFQLVQFFCFVFHSFLFCFFSPTIKIRVFKSKVFEKYPNLKYIQ